MTSLFGAIVALAGAVLVSSTVFFIVKYIRFRAARARDLRRAIYINTLGELVSRFAIPDVELEGWRKDPIFAERLIEALDIFDGAQRDHLVEIGRRIGLADDLLEGLTSRKVGRRLDAVTALSRIADEEHQAAIEHALNDPSPEVRVQAAWALARIGSPASVPKIIRRMNSEDLWAAQLMADALTEFGSAAVAAMSADVLIDSPGIEGQARYLPDLVRALGSIGDPTAEPALIHALGSEDPIIRLRAAEALGKAGSPASLPKLMRTLEDEDWRVRVKAAAAMGDQRDGRGLKNLRSALRDSEWWVRQAAAESIGRIVGGQQVLMDALDDEDRFARDAAIERLTLTGAVRQAREAGEGDELYDKLVAMGRSHLVGS